ncbi:MAG TPA: hypothetical protein DIW47_08885 [Bacteroidetes bacterium]|nr:hypothetical protein [Bacteroidota bacterium]
MTISNQIGTEVFLFTIILFGSCGKSEQQIREEKYQDIKQKEQQLKLANDSAISLLNQKYNAISGWDSLEMFSFQLQEMFVDQRRPISFEGRILDIIKSDSTYLLKVYRSTWYFPPKDHLALISISNAMFPRLKKMLKPENNFIEGCFVFDVSSITSLSPKLSSDLVNGEDSYSYLDFDFESTLLIFKGDLIDFHLDQSAVFDNEWKPSRR